MVVNPLPSKEFQISCAASQTEEQTDTNQFARVVDLENPYIKILSISVYDGEKCKDCHPPPDNNSDP